MNPSERVMSVTIPSASGSQAILVPNGCVFETANPKDAFLGALRLVAIEVFGGPSTPVQGVMDVYDAIVASTGKNLNSGTSAASTPNGTDQWRATISTNNLLTTAEGSPYVINVAPNAQVTGLRKITSCQVFSDPATGATPIIVGFGRRFFSGCVVHVTNAGAADMTVNVRYEPLVSGFTRRRQGYAVGSTTRRTHSATAQIPL